MKGNRAKPQKTSGEKSSKQKGDGQYSAHLRTKPKEQNEIESFVRWAVIMR